MRADPVLELKDLSKSFDGLRAVRDVNLTVLPGDRKAIIGPNGAGKTTLFNVITGIYPATSGQVLLFGRDVNKLAEPSAHRARHSAYIPGHQLVPDADGSGQRAIGYQWPA